MNLLPYFLANAVESLEALLFAEWPSMSQRAPVITLIVNGWISAGHIPVLWTAYSRVGFTFPYLQLLLALLLRR